ncbi:hypothetical protein LEP1GSC058_2511 [Leptospira fainei serovar Hurstbridge str. BUT 6]|uniref:Uncharacterized protein n=1 Tax=Leptospira fainei serovar Hurstbridge str. BUT 6 TaxID=1193011 RepID=S3VDI3_9LEPT|nr:hypothetical protein LEP1GSC058_2511 [Leptospira fainei serovar Hurstbridge str. BUT 6]
MEYDAHQFNSKNVLLSSQNRLRFNRSSKEITFRKATRLEHSYSIRTSFRRLNESVDRSRNISTLIE